jgi:hypothetical protein
VQFLVSACYFTVKRVKQWTTKCAISRISVCYFIVFNQVRINLLLLKHDSDLFRSGLKHDSDLFWFGLKHDSGLFRFGLVYPCFG